MDGDGLRTLVAANPIHTSSNTRRVYLVLGSSITPVDFDLSNGIMYSLLGRPKTTILEPTPLVLGITTEMA